jgi:uncharacterized protein YbjT (DUF2867 family)
VASDDHGTTLPYRLLVKPLLRALLGGLSADMAVMEETIRRSGLDWTIVRPPQLTDGPRTGTWRQARDSNLRGGDRISQADLADPILAAVDDPDTIKATITIGYRPRSVPAGRTGNRVHSTSGHSVGHWRGSGQPHGAACSQTDVGRSIPIVPSADPGGGDLSALA